MEKEETCSWELVAVLARESGPSHNSGPPLTLVLPQLWVRAWTAGTPHPYPLQAQDAWLVLCSEPGWGGREHGIVGQRLCQSCHHVSPAPSMVWHTVGAQLIFMEGMDILPLCLLRPSSLAAQLSAHRCSSSTGSSSPAGGVHFVS